jgi:polyisoprenoid-binding protein YceI
MRFTRFVPLLAFLATVAVADPVAFKIDPDHTHPAFETDHSNGLSVWRGTFRTTSGSITLDAAAHTGTVEVVVDISSVDLAMPKLEAHVQSGEMLDVEHYPTATYRGRRSAFKGDVPGAVEGEFTLHGVTHPLKLTIRSFKCQPTPMTRKFVCGADAVGEFDRSTFGVDYGKYFGFKMNTRLMIQVEAIKEE